MSFSDIAARMRKHADDKAEKAETGPRNFEEIYLLRARSLGVLIRDARQAADLSVDEVAAQVGIPSSLLVEWEYGHSMPSLPQVELLAYAMNLPLSHFWGTETLLQQAQRRGVRSEDYAMLRNRMIGALLRMGREKRNLSIDDLAGEVGILPNHLAAYELGQRPIPLPVLTSLAQVCRVNLSYFLEEGNRVGEFLTLQEDLKRFVDMPEEMRHFVSSPVNQAYLDLAMKLARLSSPELRGIAEAILNITL
ncbi:MAG TPA: helix-turn-helix transcriptional regulator [Aggregatilineaceae bacterium]|nr:helix-turn-helix transcriptional regulator [Aggregatilineaceae bacterium]